MAPFVLPNTVQVRLIWAISGVEYAVNVLHFRNDSAVEVNQTLANQLAGDTTTAFTTAMGTSVNINASTGISRLTVRNIAVANQPEFVATVTGAVGTGTQEILPRQVTLCVTLRTALAGRRFRGRVYVPGWTENANDTTGRATELARTQAEAIALNIRANYASRSLVLGVGSRVANATTPVTAVVARDRVWDNQRRRNVVGIGA